MVVARQQTLVQLTDELAALLDARAARTGRSRSALIREAITQYLRDDLEAAIDAAIVEGYTRIPQEPDPCVVTMDDVMPLPKGLLAERICRLRGDRMVEVCRALAVATGCA